MAWTRSTRREGDPARRGGGAPGSVSDRARPGLAWKVAVLLALLLTALTVVLWSQPAFTHSSSFPDVGEAHVGHDAIEFLTDAGVLCGYSNGRFGPEDPVKRGQATKILVLWKAMPLSGAPAPFNDVDSTYRAYVQTAYAAGWIAKSNDSAFRPYDILTREQMAVMMVRAMGWGQEAAKLSEADIAQILSAFVDRAEVSAEARPLVAVAVSRGLFQGTTDGHLNPKDGITRGQFCLVVMRAELSTKATITKVSSSTGEVTGTRVTIELSRKPEGVKAAISADGLLMVDITGGAMAGVLRQGIGTAEVVSMEARQTGYSPRTLRVVLDLGRYQSFKVTSLAASGTKGDRLVVDVYKRTDGPSGDGPPLVCVDAGHGGSDPGAIGVIGSKEKDINLAIALLLAKELRDSGLRVVMTRDDDSYPTLQERADTANAAEATLFVSIHNNAHSDGDVQGTVTFYWGTEDNYSVKGKLLAEAIQRNLVAELGSKDLTARTHWYNLVVLAETRMPAALIEVGFLTNAAEEARLMKTSYRSSAARGISKGILEYLGWSTKIHTSL